MNARAAIHVGGSTPLLGALLACAALLGETHATTASTHAEPADHVVTIDGLQFQPASLTVHRGDRVTWVNKDLLPHSATGPKGSFDSASIPAGGSWSFVAGKSGTFVYVCMFHPTMKGVLTVK